MGGLLFHSYHAWNRPPVFHQMDVCLCVAAIPAYTFPPDGSTPVATEGTIVFFASGRVRAPVVQTETRQSLTFCAANRWWKLYVCVMFSAVILSTVCAE